MKNQQLKRAGWLGVVAAGLALAAFAVSQDEDPAEPEAASRQNMTAERLGELVLKVDGEATLSGSTWIFTVEGLDALVVYDESADRMRIMIPVTDSSGLKPERLMRLMQANFDSALDARYAIAQGMLWGTFIHPLSTLTDEEFLVGLGQTANVVTSYGTSYSSGMFIFGSGDTADIERQRLIDKLKELQT